jgi:hypothetical protein
MKELVDEGDEAAAENCTGKQRQTRLTSKKNHFLQIFICIF